MDETARAAEDKKVNRGREAQQLLDHPMLKEAFGSVRDACLKTFATDALDPEQLLRAWLVYRLFLMLEAYIAKAIRDGADASHILAAMERTDQVNGQG